MRLANDRENYGLVAILLHWLVALVIYGLFGLGIWMRDLGYYDPWYQLGPWWHKGIGVMLFFVFVLRLAWRFITPRPDHLPTHKHYERWAASLVHWLFYLLILIVMISGYLITTADGRSLEVFDWFEIPATLSVIDGQEDIAGKIHLYLAWGIVLLSLLHTLAALKHHFFDHDRSLKRMLGI
ncbi:MAG: cytochrome b [Candidatus Thiodiazotropha endolucinida]